VVSRIAVFRVKNIFIFLKFSIMKKTLENLTKAFVGESQARNRYAMFASVARKE